MPSEKSRPINPAAAQRKLEKTRALRKSKAAIQAQRTTRLATRNPLRLEQTIASLKSLRESQGGKLGPQEKKALEDAERDLVRVRKARETVGVKDGPPGREEGGGGGRGRGAGGQGLGVKRLRREMEGKNKEEWESEEEEQEDEETDEDVRRIPMPRDTPPPIPRRPHPHPASTSTSASASNANLEPLGPARIPPSSYTPDDTTTTTTTTSQSPASAPAPAPTAIKIYESAPQVRDLRREAVASFVPEVVRRKLDAVRGKGKLLEEEELRELEIGGYTNVVGGGGTSATGGEMKKKDRGDEEEEGKFRKEEERFEREVRMVASVEEVDDEDE